MPAQLPSHMRRTTVAEEKAVLDTMEVFTHESKITVSDFIRSAIREKLHREIEAHPEMREKLLNVFLRHEPRPSERPLRTPNDSRKFKNRLRQFDSLSRALAVETIFERNARNSCVGNDREAIRFVSFKF